MKTYNYSGLSPADISQLCQRPAIDFEKVFEIVKPVLADIKVGGLNAALEYAKKFDGFEEAELRVSEEEFSEAKKYLSPEVKNAINIAAINIRKFHERQLHENYSVETMKGVNCSREYRPIENVGLYIPGGTAILPSTMLMLGIPAAIAGCKRVVVCSPAKKGKTNPALVYAAWACGIKEFYKIGGSQAVALMAYGDPELLKVDKIFGPGNQYVTAAKMLVSIDPKGCAIDMPAGPSEVLVIADENANPAFAAADLLAQAEHGVDSQVILITTSENTAEKIMEEVDAQLKIMSRKEIAEKALKNSFALIVNSIDEAISFSNLYAPEHLIINTNNAGAYKNKIINAGSVFLGPFSPESAGDYASGTNHSLPTSGYARITGGVSVESFMKSITFQELSKEGLKNISSAVEVLAETEGLMAHKNSVTIRLTGK